MSQAFYTGAAYAAQHPNWHREHSEWKAGQISALLAANRVSPRTVVEVGCGAGGILAALQRKLSPLAELTGYEIAPAALELAAPLANQRLRFVLGDFSIAEPSGAPTDVLLAIDVVEHVEDYLGFLRALRPRAARHVFHFPLDLSLLAMARPEHLRWARDSVGHLHYFTAETVLRALENAGYRICDRRFTAVELDLPAPAGQRQRLRALRRVGRRINAAWTSRVLGGFSLLVLCGEPVGAAA